MSNKKKYEGEKEMAESRKMKTEKGLALVPGANPLADGCNFAVEVPEDSRASLILYKKLLIVKSSYIVGFYYLLLGISFRIFIIFNR